MDDHSLRLIAYQLLVPNKGLLAADESAKTVEKRFAPINLPNTEDNRRAFRELFFTAPGISQYISGVILYDETIRQQASTGQMFVSLLQEQNIIPGIKVDLGLEPMPNSLEEKVTKGLDGLAERLAEYVSLGAKFAKWRAELEVSEALPSQACIEENNHRLTEYAWLCQQAGLVPIVEPEVMMTGNHSLERCQQVTTQVLENLFTQLKAKGVVLEGLLLKSNMVIAGKDFATPSTPEQVASATIQTFTQAVPKEVAGIVFLSGGQSERQATSTLNEIEKRKDLPWPLTFSYARALQDSATKVWAGKPENLPAAQAEFVFRAKLNSLARQGKYDPAMEHPDFNQPEASSASQD